MSETKSMVWLEKKIPAWLHFRKRKTLELASNLFNLNGEKVHPADIRKMTISDAWCSFPLLPVKRIRIPFVQKNSRESIDLLFIEAEAEAINRQISQFVEAYLNTRIQELRKTIDEIEQAVTALYDPLRFVRHSHAKGLAEEHAKKFDETADALARYIKRDMLTAVHRSQAQALDARSALVKPFLLEWPENRTKHNASYIAHFKKEQKAYFNSVESSPLTDEQILSSLIFEDGTLVVAAAGSGKSSCIVGKIGFALNIGLYRDDQILALAYNSGAAEELRTRLSEKLQKALGRVVKVESRTFHSFGLSVMLQHYGPAYEPNVLKEDGKEEGRFIKSAITTLHETSDAFRNALADWVLMAAYADPQPVGTSDDVVDCARRYEECCRDRIQAKKTSTRPAYKPTIPTFSPEIYVRSLQERSIANWLMLHQIPFEYEMPDWEAAKRLGIPARPGKKRPPYTPDFTYIVTPSLANNGVQKLRIVHEHFALNANNEAPEFMGGEKYVTQAGQKRKMYQAWESEPTPAGQEQIHFIETTSAEFYSGDLFTHLKNRLTDAGVVVGTPDPAIQQQALASFRSSSNLEKLLIGFVLNFKESGLTKDEVTKKANQSSNPYRAGLFIKVAFHVYDAYQAELKAAGKIDFADMLRDAHRLLAEKTVKVPYRFVLVDEFQDIAKLKADLVKSVLDQAPEESIVFCVGDDWQTINRFAGSDVGIFTGMEGYFGRHTERVDLPKTFRCAQGIANVSRSLVMRRNKSQFDKKVVSVNPKVSDTVRIIEHGSSAEERQARLIDELDRIIQQGPALELELSQYHERATPAVPRIPSVQILRRTKTEATVPEGMDDKFLEQLIEKYEGRLDIELKTMHGSKGLQADFVILPGLDSGRRGFPGTREPEVLFDLVLPRLDDFMEEERRLFYVGLTRARHQAILLTNAERPSQFVLELLEQSNANSTITLVSHETKRIPCSDCRIGSMILPYPTAQLRSCSRGPVCMHRESIN